MEHKMVLGDTNLKPSHEPGDFVLEERAPRRSGHITRTMGDLGRTQPGQWIDLGVWDRDPLPQYAIDAWMYDVRSGKCKELGGDAERWDADVVADDQGRYHKLIAFLGAPA